MSWNYQAEHFNNRERIVGGAPARNYIRKEQGDDGGDALYIKGVPLYMTKDDLEQYIKTAGVEALTVKMMVANAEQFNSNCAIVKLASAKECLQVIDRLSGKPPFPELIISFAKKDKNKKSEGNKNTQPSSRQDCFGFDKTSHEVEPPVANTNGNHERNAFPSSNENDEKCPIGRGKPRKLTDFKDAIISPLENSTKMNVETQLSDALATNKKSPVSPCSTDSGIASAPNHQPTQPALTDKQAKMKKNKVAKCIVCGDPGTTRCSICKAPYCSRDCQVDDWYLHKANCAPPPPLEDITTFSGDDISSRSSIDSKSSLSRSSSSPSPPKVNGQHYDSPDCAPPRLSRQLLENGPEDHYMPRPESKSRFENKPALCNGNNNVEQHPNVNGIRSNVQNGPRQFPAQRGNAQPNHTVREQPSSFKEFNQPHGAIPKQRSPHKKFPMSHHPAQTQSHQPHKENRQANMPVKSQPAFTKENSNNPSKPYENKTSLCNGSNNAAPHPNVNNTRSNGMQNGPRQFQAQRGNGQPNGAVQKQQAPHHPAQTQSQQPHKENRQAAVPVKSQPAPIKETAKINNPSKPLETVSETPAPEDRTFSYDNANFAHMEVGQTLKVFMRDNSTLPIFCVSPQDEVIANGEKYHVMAQEMQDYCNKNKSSYSPALEELVLVKFTADEQWYRAACLGVHEDTGLVNVLFVDYGNMEDVSKDNILIMAPKFMDLPLLVVHCLIEGVPLDLNAQQKEAIGALFPPDSELEVKVDSYCDGHYGLSSPSVLSKLKDNGIL